MALKVMDYLIKEGKSFVLDGTGANPGFLKENLMRVKKEGYKTRLVYVDVPLSVALKQNQNRERKLPDFVIEKVWERVESSWKQAKYFPYDKIDVIWRKVIEAKEFNKAADILLG